MFQTYEDSANPALGIERAAKLREELRRRGLDGFLIPRADEHQGEYVPPHAERLRWLTGFNGSAGMAIVLKDKAAIFVDGRYTLQVRGQVDLDTFEAKHLMEEPPTRWIEENLPKGAKLAYDPWLHTIDAVARLRAAAERAGGTLVPVDTNPLDAVWDDQPEPPVAKVNPHGLEYAGEPAAEKIRRIAADLMVSDADTAVLTMPDSIAWLFNIRGQDVPHTPLPLSFALLHEDGHAELFIDERKLDDAARAHLGNIVTVHPREALGGRLDELGQAKKTVLVDPATCASWIDARLKAAGAEVKRGTDPCELPKAIKNEAEVAGTRAAHLRDGQALTKFLKWVGTEAPKGGVTEIDAAKRLEAFRAETGKLKDVSFDTISGAGANGAIVHYRVTEATNRPLNSGELFLVDSGAQYMDGTTDVTRTIAIGTPGAEERDRFTRVLKGHIGIATARFPEGTSGAQLDAFARMALWKAGLDYDHGTGHGVGSYLSVHEGPQRISKMGHVPLRAGMIVSNEPGYYKTGGYGIRIENLVVVTPPAPVEGGERMMMGFETLTLAPIDLALVERRLLTDEEADWLNAYHARVRAALSPGLDAETKAWLEEATRAI
ncbi:aminopeptidase P family protein [Parvibaculum sp.]|uniref:aminopeptidase P family protein n=1 Tax=Parvibaculum sp. TaxID=2024848 RepID=UPI000C3EDC91|nr:aminopeptidase P family protein [Parvibaculum sp.]MAU59902.1 X-Pro aminopeptidase [Parvibaculum sp.]MBO6668842.1 aminopeptidase P family protein [Parvibaculum sp.]MBO6693137.1 aminopeptidase P family protein [Parvibaculum sp.]MBO6715702.1 aminopeptidase P family protein [Parvibaculum sp.]|tara:strand:+ start:5141 stop:6955 length:1815 start_codon:yes stop_codon:yes gene_type:complete